MAHRHSLRIFPPNGTPLHAQCISSGPFPPLAFSTVRTLSEYAGREFGGKECDEWMAQMEERIQRGDLVDLDARARDRERRIRAGLVPGLVPDTPTPEQASLD